MTLAPRYNIIDDYPAIRPTSDAERARIDQVSYTPYCVVLVLPLALPASCDRSKILLDMQGKSVSIAKDPAEGVRLRSKPLTINDDIRFAHTNESKSDYRSRLQLLLSNSTTNYLAALLPGDWVFCWMLTSEVRARGVIDRIRKLDPCNRWDDGLRFIGQVKDVDRDRESRRGQPAHVQTSVACAGYGQLGSSTFYDPFLAEATPLMGTWLARIGGAISELLGEPLPNGGGGLDINRLMPFFVKLLLGEGIAERYANPTTSRGEFGPGGDRELLLQIGTGDVRADSKEAPYALVVPGQVGQLLGKRNPERSTVLAYADVVELITGVQTFSGGAGQSATTHAPWAGFTPDGVPVNSTPDVYPDAPSHKQTNKKLLGSFIPTVPSFAGKEVWALLRQWLNPSVNEMYTTLRANEAGQVVPTIVVRQLPLSSVDFATAMQGEGLQLTPFLNVPRWVGHPCLVKKDRVGRTDDLRFNFVHVYGQSLDSQVASRYTSQIIRSPPARDDLDIQRSGLRPFTATVACSINESADGSGARKWIAVASDWLMDQHLTLSGTATMELVAGPIAKGDNFEYDGVVYQIEGTSHHFTCSPQGMRSAETTLQLTHGLRSDTDPAYDERSGEIGDSYLFAAFRERDQRAYDGSVSAQPGREEVRYANTRGGGDEGFKVR